MAHLYEADLDCILRLLRCPECSCLAAACACLCLGCVCDFGLHPPPAQILRMLMHDSCCVCCACGRCLGAFVPAVHFADTCSCSGATLKPS